MNSDILRQDKYLPDFSAKSSKNDNKSKKPRRNNYSDGYIEEWYSSSILPSVPIPHSIKSNKNESEQNKSIEPIKLQYNPVSMILSIQNNLLLNKSNSYNIRFGVGMVEGNGISINESGDTITFQDEGSYRFEISGDGILFSDVDVKLIYFNEKFSDDVKSFSEITIPKDEGKLQLRGIPTILPIRAGQSIVAKLLPSPDESIILNAGTRLIIHRVA